MVGLFDFSNYTTYVAIVQVVAAFVIYYITNWLGGHTPSDRGYMSLSLVIVEDTMPAFNFVFKTLTPIILYVLFIALFQSFDFLTTCVVNSYMVIVYYWAWRILYYIFHGVWSLINKFVLLLYIAATIGLALWIYSFVERVQTILPDKNALRDQLWILIAIFLYQVFNNLQINRKGTEERKKKYIQSKYAEFRKKYGDIVTSQCETLVDEGLVYSIMIVENYNRPPFIRIIEYIKFFITRRKMSLGIMQVKTNKWIDDKQSVQLGANLIVKMRQDYVDTFKSNSENRYMNMLCHLIDNVANKYNGNGDTYADEVKAIFEIINHDIFPDTWDVNVLEALEK